MRLALIVIAAGMAFAQDAKLQFEVASVKLSAADARPSVRGGPASDDPGHFTCVHCTVRSLELRATGAGGYQLSEPPGTEDILVDVAAKIPPGATKEQFNSMLLNLIVERFSIKLHRETRELAGYNLVIAKGGLKMHEAVPATGSDLNYSNESIKTVQSPDGKPLLAPGRKGRITLGLGNGRQRISARLQNMTDIVQLCEARMGKPVINETGLKGVYDFYIDFATPGRGGPASDVSSTPLGTDDPAAPFEIAIETALGLKLQPKKLQIEVTVIDQMSKTPIEN